jgi:hypothetical protein
MLHLILDTNIWLYLANGFYSESTNPNNLHFDLLDQLIKLKEDQHFEILISDITILEWDRNKKQAYQLIEKLERKIKAIQCQLQEMKKVAHYEDHCIN